MFKAKDFINSIGVAVHLQYSDGAYAWHDENIAKLKWLGVTHLRDLAPKSIANRPPYSKYTAAGFDFSMICMPQDAAITDATKAGEVFDRILKYFPDAKGIVNLEGPNEPNNGPITFGNDKDSKTEFSATISYMAALRRAQQEHPLFKDIPLSGVSCYPDLTKQVAPYVDRENVHYYPTNGSQNGGGMDKYAGRKVVITEFGYNPGPRDGHAQRVTNERVLATLMINGLFNAFRAGVIRTYLYELRDEKLLDDYGCQWGLFRWGKEGIAKPAGWALHNLTTILADVDGEIDSTPPPYSFKGLPSTARVMHLRKTNKRRYVIVWNEADAWDEKSLKPIYAAPTYVEMALGYQATVVNQYNLLDSERPVAIMANRKSVGFYLTNDPVILEI